MRELADAVVDSGRIAGSTRLLLPVPPPLPLVAVLPGPRRAPALPLMLVAGPAPALGGGVEAFPLLALPLAAGLGAAARDDGAADAAAPAVPAAPVALPAGRPAAAACARRVARRCCLCLACHIAACSSAAAVCEPSAAASQRTTRAVTREATPCPTTAGSLSASSRSCGVSASASLTIHLSMLAVLSSVPSAASRGFPEGEHPGQPAVPCWALPLLPGLGGSVNQLPEGCCWGAELSCAAGAADR